MQNFVERIIAWSLHNHLVVLFLTGLMAVIGVVCFRHTPIEAYPDVTNTRVRVIAQWPGRSADEVEKFVTLPVMQKLNTIPRKTDVRSTSLFGLSVVTVLFEDGVDDFYAQQYASNRMQEIALPDGASIEIEPPSGATGEIFRYYIKSDLPVREVAAIDEWVVQRELLSVPGVATITSFGGEEKIFEVKANPIEMRNYGITPLQLFRAMEESNINVGGDVIKRGSQAYVVRGIGLLESVEDIETLLVDVQGNSPIRVKQIASVSVSSRPRLGQVGLNDDDDIVQGIVVMLRGQNPTEVIKRVKEKIEELNTNILPQDVQVVPFMDRTKLVNTTLQTVAKNMLTGICLVSVIVFIFLANIRAAFVVVSVMPLAFLFAIIMLRIQGLPANLISMGALDFGLMLQGPLVLVEIIFVSVLAKSKQLGEGYRRLAKSGLIKRSASPIAYGIFSGLIILMLALSPIFSFQKVEGKMFSPLAFTLGYALLGSLILSLTYVPVMCKILLAKPIREHKNPLNHFLPWLMFALYRAAARFRVTTLVLFVLLLCGCVARFMFWGSEFIPKINEGAVYIRATLPNSVNLDESVKLTLEMKHRLRQFGEVEYILTQTGRPNDGTDATGFFNIEFHVELKPEREWARKISKEALISEMETALDVYPGIVFGFSQPIQDNVEEYVAGVKSALVIKIFGSDLHQLEALADQTAGVVKQVRGVDDVNVFRSIGLPELQILPQENLMAKYAVSMADAQAVIEMAIGGKAATTFYEGERMFDVVVRFAPEFRDNAEKIGDILIPTMDGKQVPLKEIAEIRSQTGAAFIYREGGSRYVGVGFSIRGRDLGTTIGEAQRKVSEAIILPKGNKMVWAGEFESQQRAIKRLMVIVPSALLLSLFVLYLTFGTIRDCLVVVSSMPYAFIGGFLAILFSGTTFGISVGVGFIIMFGIESIDNIVLVTGMKRMLHQTRDLKLAIGKGVRQRLRPVLMTSLISAFGLLPAALSTGIGSEVQRPLATVIVGGQLICMILSFTVTPQVFYFLYRKHKLIRHAK